MQGYSSGLPGTTLSAALTARSKSLTVAGVPAGLPAGRYDLKLDSELLNGSYPGGGRTFGDLQRGLDGTTAASHRAGVTVHHPITGAALNRLARLTRPNPPTRPPALRAYIASNFF